ncbi:MAG TPA: hypothetical protein VFY65_04275, partial [Longimicrobium sp.]|nr:hypothetical protein [Longimicrobium sp.]
MNSPLEIRKVRLRGLWRGCRDRRPVTMIPMVHSVADAQVPGTPHIAGPQVHEGGLREFVAAVSTAPDGGIDARPARPTRKTPAADRARG